MRCTRVKRACFIDTLVKHVQHHWNTQISQSGPFNYMCSSSVQGLAPCYGMSVREISRDVYGLLTQHDGTETVYCTFAIHNLIIAMQHAIEGYQL